MTDVKIMGVDERDSTWEEGAPRFRVYLHASGDSTTGGGTATYDVTGADLLQVIDWAQTQAGPSQTYAIALVCDAQVNGTLAPHAGRGLVWLVGMDGNDEAMNDLEADAQRRMLLRRSDPVIVPRADRLPLV